MTFPRSIQAISFLSSFAEDISVVAFDAGGKVFADGNELDFYDSHYSSAVKREFDLTFYGGRLGNVHS